MSDPTQVNIQAGDFSAHIAHDAEAPVLIVALSGSADWRVRATLDSLLRQVSADVDRLGFERVDVDMRELDFMNSSCFKTMVTWLMHLPTGNPKHICQVRLLARTSATWLQRSLAAMACVASDRVTVVQA